MPLERRQGVAVLNRARAHVDAGDLATAQELLSQALTALPTDPRKARPVEAEWVALQTGVLLSLGEPYAARGWAAYGHSAFRRLYGDRDRRTLHTLGLLAAVLTRVGAHAPSAEQYERLIEICTETEGPQADRTLSAQADLATVEHARGECVTARTRLAAVIAEHQQIHGTAHAIGVRMVARLAMMWRDCGDFDYAHGLLAQARSYAAGLPVELHDLLSVAAKAPAEQRHVCGASTVSSAIQQPFSTQSYLPAHPELVAWAPSRADRSSDDAAGWQLSPATLALIASIVGIVAVAVLLVLMISAVRSG